MDHLVPNACLNLALRTQITCFKWSFESQIFHLRFFNMYDPIVSNWRQNKVYCTTVSLPESEILYLGVNFQLLKEKCLF